jgi:hypothetical protein
MKAIALPTFVLALALNDTLAGVTPDLRSAAYEPSNAGLEPLIVYEPLSSSWNFTAGYQYRQIGGLEVQTGSHAANILFPWKVGRASGTGGKRASAVANIGSPSAYADRTYDDGYVFQDAGTPAFGDTWNWGYNNASQRQGGALSLHSTDGTSESSHFARSQSRLLDDNAGWNDELAGSGWFAKLESPAVFRLGPLHTSLELAYSFTSADTGHLTPGIFSLRQESLTSHTRSVFVTTDTYDVSGISVPTAPHKGTFAGPGPLISNIPQNRTSGVGSKSNSSEAQTVEFFSNAIEQLEFDLHTLSIGPHFTWETRRVQVGLSTGLALNIVDWSGEYEENVLYRRNGGNLKHYQTYRIHDGGTDVLPGFYLELNSNLRVTSRLSLFASGRYDFSETLNADLGPSSVKLDIGGWTVSGGLSISF